MKKCLFSIIISLLSLFAFSTVAYAENHNYIAFQVDNPSLSWNGQHIPIDTVPIVQDGRTLVPLRALVDTLRGEVDWYPDERKITISLSEWTVISLGESGYTVLEGDKQEATAFMERLESYLGANEEAGLETAVKDLGGIIRIGTATVTLEKNNIIELWVDKTTALVNSQEKTLDVSPIIKDGRTLIPLRFVSENFGMYVKWIADGSYIIIGYEEITPELEAKVEYPSTASGATGQSTTPPTAPSNIVLPAVAQKPDVATTIVEAKPVDKSSPNYGTIVLSDGSNYEGETTRDVPGLGLIRDPVAYGWGYAEASDGTTYLGEWDYYVSRSLPSGVGIFTYPNGDRYEGNVIGHKDMVSMHISKPHGYGRYTYANGDVYQGDWLYNYGMYFEGVCVYENGEWYDGQWQEGKPNGNGRYGYLSGEVLEGYFTNGEFAGGGFIDGEFYYFLSEKYFTNGDVYEGKFVNGKPDGAGTYTFANGDRQEGIWSAGQPTGEVTFYYANGDKYDGEWKNGKPDGDGKKTFANGEVQDGTWSDGVFVAPRLISAPSQGGSQQSYKSYIAQADAMLKTAQGTNDLGKSILKQQAAQYYRKAMSLMEEEGLTNSTEYTANEIAAQLDANNTTSQQAESQSTPENSQASENASANDSSTVPQSALNAIRDGDRLYDLAQSADVYLRQIYLGEAANQYKWAIQYLQSQGLTDTPEYRHCVSRLK